MNKRFPICQLLFARSAHKPNSNAPKWVTELLTRIHSHTHSHSPHWLHVYVNLNFSSVPQLAHQRAIVALKQWAFFEDMRIKAQTKRIFNTRSLSKSAFKSLLEIESINANKFFKFFFFVVELIVLHLVEPQTCSLLERLDNRQLKSDSWIDWISELLSTHFKQFAHCSQRSQMHGKIFMCCYIAADIETLLLLRYRCRQVRMLFFVPSSMTFYSNPNGLYWPNSSWVTSGICKADFVYTSLYWFPLCKL